MSLDSKHASAIPSPSAAATPMETTNGMNGVNELKSKLAHATTTSNSLPLAQARGSSCIGQEPINTLPLAQARGSSCIGQEPITPSATTKPSFPPLTYLSEYGRIVGMCDLNGRSAPVIDRYHKSEFTCQHCLLPVYDYPVGYCSAMQINPKTKKQEFIVSGQLAANCMYTYAESTVYMFHRELVTHGTTMLLRAYGVNPMALLQKRRDTPAPRRHELPMYNSSSSIVVKDGHSFHDEYRIPLNAPDPNKIQFFEAPITLLVESHNLEPWTEGKEAFAKAFPSLVTESATLPIDPNSVLPNPKQILERINLALANETAQQKEQALALLNQGYVVPSHIKPLVFPTYADRK